MLKSFLVLDSVHSSSRFEQAIGRHMASSASLRVSLFKHISPG